VYWAANALAGLAEKTGEDVTKLWLLAIEHKLASDPGTSANSAVVWAGVDQRRVGQALLKAGAITDSDEAFDFVNDAVEEYEEYVEHL